MAHVLGNIEAKNTEYDRSHQGYCLSWNCHGCWILSVCMTTVPRVVSDSLLLLRFGYAIPVSKCGVFVSVVSLHLR